jgi:hypothetical protein
MALLRDSEGGWRMAIRCHERITQDKVLWGDLAGGDVVVGPAFDPAATAGAEGAVTFRDTCPPPVTFRDSASDGEGR